MHKSLSWFGIGFALVTIAACAHRANPSTITSGITEDSPQTVGGEFVGTQNAGSEGPVADHSRLAINHRDVMAQEDRERERLARLTAPAATSVSDVTIVDRSAAAAPPAPDRVAPRKHARPHKRVLAKRTGRDHVRTRSGAPAMAPAPETVLGMNRESVLNRMHHENQKQIRLAKLASDRADSPALRYTAGKVQADHLKLDSDLEKLAKRRGVKLASFQPSDFEGVTLEKMKTLAGHTFDYAYRQQVRDDHHFVAMQLRTLRNRVGDPEIISLIDETMPVLVHKDIQERNTLSSIRTNNDYSARSE